MSETHPTDRIETVNDWLVMIRVLPRVQLVLIVLGILVGTIIALEHWVGFVLMGVVIGIVSRSLGQAIVSALVIGGLAIVAFLAYAWYHDQLLTVLALGELTLISVLVPLVLIVFGSLIRGVT